MRISVAAGMASLVGLFVLGPACSSSSGGSGFGSSSGSSGGSSNGSSGGSSSSGGGSGGSSSGLLGDGGSSGDDGGGCPVPSPGNYPFPGDGCNDDGNGPVTTAAVCDQTLSATGTAHDFANAMGLCHDAPATGPGWGIVSATYTQGFAGGSPNDGQHGILPKFGGVIVPKEGSNLGVLSSGYAREWDDIQGAYNNDCSSPYMQTNSSCFKGLQVAMTGAGTAPPGYPKPAAGCMNATSVLDAISVTLKIKVPANAQGFQFDFDFYSGEWPEYVCTPFNDSFVAWLQSTAFTGNPPMSGDLNISFDAKNNPVSVNNGFFESCTTNASTGCCNHPPMYACSTATGSPALCMNGPQELAGTGFEDTGTWCGGQSTGGGATGWLTTKAPAAPGETITLQFIIWDTGDPNWDSSVILDHFTWIKGPTMTGTQPAQ